MCKGTEQHGPIGDKDHNIKSLALELPSWLSIVVLLVVYE